ncbi:MAG: helix-turn-helix transcriptional regulator [Rhodobacteraceae bacterium]|nr:helix-turn-helix transcriptional regulator [Paracoccaceae bacterium]MBR9819379.1 helix-turn-helix transcriptional regulator [Paracoccaceae bacterium]
MEDFGKTFADAVAQQLQALKKNAFAVEKEGGLPVDAIRSVVRDDEKRAVPRITRAKEICDLLGLEFYIGPPRDIGPVEQIVLDGGDYAHIPVHAATLAAGGGALNGEEPVVDHLAFKRAWLSRIGISPANAVLARVAHGELGESMMPTICPGDMVLIDTSKREIPQRPPNYKSKKSPIYAFTTEDGARVKRLAQLNDVIILVSDNPDISPEFLSKDRWSEVNVIGKVVWWGHTAEE